MKEQLKNFIFGFILVIFICIIYLIYLNLNNIRYKLIEFKTPYFYTSEMAIKTALQYSKNTRKDYNIQKAKDSYKIALKLAPENVDLYLALGENYYIIGNKIDSIKAIEKYIDSKKNSEDFNYKSHYLLGLVYGSSVSFFKNAPEKAIFNFTQYRQYVIEENKLGYLLDDWAHLLDLGWVYFNQAEFQNAESVLEEGWQKFPNNPWILNAYAMALFNNNKPQNYNQSIQLLTQAINEAEKLTISDWAVSYSLNDPLSYKKGLEIFRKTIRANLGLIETYKNSI